MPDKSHYNTQDLALITGIQKDDLDKLFYAIVELLSRDAQVRIPNFGVFKRSLYKGRKLTSPVLSGGTIEFGDQWLMRFSSYATAKMVLNKLSPPPSGCGSEADPEPEVEPEKPKSKKPKAKKSEGEKPKAEKPKGKKAKTKPAEPEDAPEIVPEIEPGPEPVKEAKTAKKAGKASLKAKGKPRKASSGVKKAS